MDLRALAHNPVVLVGVGGGGLVLVLFLSRHKTPAQAAAIPLGAVGQPQPALTGAIPGETAGAAMPAASLTQELSDVATLAGAFQSLQQQLYGMPLADSSGAGLMPPPSAPSGPAPVAGPTPPAMQAPVPMQQQIASAAAPPPPPDLTTAALAAAPAGVPQMYSLGPGLGNFWGTPADVAMLGGIPALQQAAGVNLAGFAKTLPQPRTTAGGGGFIEHASGRHLGSALGVAAGGSQLTTPWRPTRKELARRGRERHVAAFGGEA